jgi:hypothetical protein
MRMSWNYRVTYRGKNAMEGYSIREVYYNEDGDIVLYTENPVEPFGDIEEELEECLRLMQMAFEKPTLNLDGVDYLIRTNPGSVKKR